MKNLVIAGVIGIGAALAFAATANARHEIIAPQLVSADVQEEGVESFTFVFDTGVPADLVHDIATRLADTADSRVIHIYSDDIRGFSARMTRDAAEKLAADSPMIRYFEADGLTATSVRRPASLQQTP